MTPYITTDSAIHTILRCERQKKELLKNPLNRFMKKEKLKALDTAIAANFSLLHDFYPQMDGIYNIQVFKELNDKGLLTRYSRCAVISSPTTVLSEGGIVFVC